MKKWGTNKREEKTTARKRGGWRCFIGNKQDGEMWRGDSLILYLACRAALLSLVCLNLSTLSACCIIPNNRLRISFTTLWGEREGGKEGGEDGGEEGGRGGRREGGREGKKERRREGKEVRREGEREQWRGGERERGRDGEKERERVWQAVCNKNHCMVT